MRYEIKPRTQIDKRDLMQMHCLRTEVFSGRLGWSVSVFDGSEIDRYDTDKTLYMLMYDKQNKVCGCWRLINTQAPYMLENDFSSLLQGRPARHEANVWELSRFALKRTGSGSYGFSKAAVGAIQHLVQWARSENVTEFLTVTTVSIYRLMEMLGLDIELICKPQKIGSVMTIAARFYISEKTERALFAQPRKIA